MKATASTPSRQLIAQRLSLGQAFESAFGAGMMTASDQSQTGGAGWTTERLIAMSKAIAL